MKNLLKISILTFVAFFFLNGLGANESKGQLFGSPELNWEKVLIELKKINARLVFLHNKGLPTLHRNQAEMMDQMRSLRNMLPGTQGITQDMEPMVAANQEQFQQMTQNNEAALAAMKLQMDKQADRTGQVIGHLSKILEANANQFQALNTRLDNMGKDLKETKERLAVF